MSVTPTRTLNPLPFEHLEVHRFEDLVRQLAYDFKHWRRLEATGRAGSDDGFDARGFEIVAPESEERSTDLDEDETPPPFADRLWLIQCKREKKIGPEKLVGYLEEISAEERKTLYGIVLAAPATFSKKSRDRFFEWCSSNGIQEAHLWGREELEDALFQPKNDHLLFAYFGISLRIRERTVASRLRSLLAIKRKANRMLEGQEGRPLLLRNAEIDFYPYIEDVNTLRKNAYWRVLRFDALKGEGLQFQTGLYFAYWDTKTGEWDAALGFDREALHQHDDPWLGLPHGQTADEKRAKDAWLSLPEVKRASVRIWGLVTYDQILDIDDIGDEHFEEPHIYMRPAFPAIFCRHGWANIYSDASNEQRELPKDRGRIVVFPKDLRERD